METPATIAVIAACALLIWLLVAILKTPMKLILKLLLNMLCGFVMLFVFNFIGGFFDLSLGVNATNALVAGVLATPGWVLSILLQPFLLFLPLLPAPRGGFRAAGRSVFHSRFDISASRPRKRFSSASRLSGI